MVITPQVHTAISHPPNLRATHMLHAREWQRMGIAGRFGQLLRKRFLHAIRMCPEILFLSVFLSKGCTTNCLIEQPAPADVLFQHDLKQGEGCLFAKLPPPFHSRVTTATCILHRQRRPSGKKHLGCSGSIFPPGLGAGDEQQLVGGSVVCL